MLDLLVSLGWGTVSLTREKAEKSLERLYRRGELRREEAKRMLKTLSERGEREKALFKEHINQKISEALQRGDLVTRREYEELQKRMEFLEQKLSQQGAENSVNEEEQ